jgi:hypothetical protein
LLTLLFRGQSSNGEGMTDDEGTEVSGEDVNASMQASFVRLFVLCLARHHLISFPCGFLQDSDSPKDSQSAEESEGENDQEEKPKGQKGTLQSEDEPPQPTNMGDARAAAKVCDIPLSFARSQEELKFCVCL